MTIINDYLELQEKFEKKYGEHTIVLMEVGSFFEIYGVVNDTVKRGRIYEVAEITNLSVSKKNSKTEPISLKNPLMAGFPNHSFDKWKNILLKNNYSIIKIEQDRHGVKDPKREITEIISPGVNLETSMKTLDFDHEKKADILKIFKLPYLEIVKLNLQYLYIPQEIAIVFEKLEEFRRENINLTNNIMGAVGSC